MVDAKASAPHKRKLPLRAIMLIGLVLVGLVSAAGFFAYQREPAHWAQQQQRIQSLSDSERQQISESLFNRATTQWSKAPAAAIKPEDLIGHRSSLEVTYDELNIWLKQDGVDLLSELGIKLPRSVRGAMVDSPGDGLLRISCDVKTQRLEQVIALTFDIRVEEDGTIVSKLTGASAGMLPLPAERAAGLIVKRDGKDGLMSALTSGTPTGPIDVPIDASKDGLRDGRLVGFEVYDDRLVITRETVLRSKAD